MLRKLFIGAFFIGIGVVTLACDMVQPQSSRPSVIISSPPSGSVYGVGEQVVVQSTASDPARILRVELIVDGVTVRQDSAPIATGQEQFSLLQTWIADRAGQRNLIVRATNAQGTTSETGIYVTVQAAAVQPTLVPSTVEGAQPTATALPSATALASATAIASATTNPVITVIVTATGAPTQTPTLVPSTVEGTTPTLTATSSITATTNSESASCTDNATFVSDVTIPDNTNFSPNAAFTKTWRVRNTGTCNWQNYQLVFSSGAQLNGAASVPVPATVAGATADISASLTAPANFGNYKGTWRLRNANGTFFGTGVTVVINVPNPNAAANATATNTTIPPTLPAAASCSGQPANFTFTASKASVTAGQSVTLNWGAVSNASIAVLNGGQFSNQGVGAPGSINASPTSTTTYTLTATCNNGGGTRSNSVTVTVSVTTAGACSGTPVINNFTASSTNVRPNEHLAFSWNTPTNADKMHFKGPGFDEDVPLVAGGVFFNPLATNPYTLTATCTASGKSVEQTITVTVTPWCTGTPNIGSFFATQTTLSPGQSASLRWDGISNAQHLMIFASGEDLPFVETFAPLASSGSVPISPAATTTYQLRLLCGGAQIARQVTVTVSNAPPACSGDIGNFFFNGTSNTVSDAQLLTIKPGESVALEWGTITNADRIRFTGGGFDDDVGAPGIRIVTPNSKTTYDLTASCSANGNSIHGSVTVDVKP